MIAHLIGKRLAELLHQAFFGAPVRIGKIPASQAAAQMKWPSVGRGFSGTLAYLLTSHE